MNTHQVSPEWFPPYVKPLRSVTTKGGLSRFTETNEVMNTKIHDPYTNDTVPEGFIESYSFHAEFECPNQQWTRCECGAPQRVFLFEHLSPECLRQITEDCNAFWNEAKQVIRSAKGRTNWHPDIDTDIHHICTLGSIFYMARNGTYFFLNYWPSPEKEEVIRISEKFGPMHLEEKEGQLVYVNGLTVRQQENVKQQKNFKS